MAKGDGSIQEVRRGVYRVSISLGRDPVTGRYKRITQTVYGTKADARKARDALRRDIEDGLKVDAGNVTFSEMVGVWEAAKRASGKAADDTVTKYVKTIRRVVDAIGDVKIKDIDPSVIDSVFSNLKRETSLSGTTLNKMFVVVKSIMQKAEDYDYIRRNPCKRCEAPKPGKPNRKALAPEECKRLRDALDEAEASEYENRERIEDYHDRYQGSRNRDSLTGIMRLSCIVAVRLMLATGMRRGEALALTWKRIDAKNARIDVIDALDRRGNPKDTKTEAGSRIVAIDMDTLSHLVKWRSAQALYLGRIGLKVNGDTPVCCSNVSGFLNPDNFEAWWRRFRAEIGFPDLKLHELRHTQATLLLANGTDVKTVQTRLGHASAAFTLDRYAHAIQEKDDQAADLMGELIEGKRKQKGRVIALKTA